MNGACGYEQRAASYAAEIAEVVAPRLLNGLLHTGMTVAEAPSGTGHFLSRYAAAQAEVVLIDASPAMLAAARPAVPGQKLRMVCCRIEELDPTQTGLADLVVVANAALNQLAAGPGPAAVLAAAARILAPGGLLLAQVLLADGDRVDGCGFYDPALPDGQPILDRRICQDDGRELVRMRRQDRHDDRVGIHFTATCDGRTVYDHQVELQLLTAAAIEEAATAADLSLIHRLDGDTEQLSEVLLATRTGQGAR
ncbi:class I SAM-dependent methyltransferase [Streptosporangium sp. CA-115845]|uniref:class I SAM-dependent methyltransferase n=1 Tax=Streptosporangium sp. CA-115845 TaxID=3240071 RepID=UPI003D8D04A5